MHVPIPELRVRSFLDGIGCDSLPRRASVRPIRHNFQGADDWGEEGCFSVRITDRRKDRNNRGAIIHRLFREHLKQRTYNGLQRSRACRRPGQ
jgi:hypothetical protein